MGMNEPGDPLPKPTYRWPWFVLAAFLLGVALAILWMGYAVHLEKRAHDFNVPSPGASSR